MENDRRASLPDTVLSSGVTEEEGRAEDAMVAPPSSQMHPGIRRNHLQFDPHPPFSAERIVCFASCTPFFSGGGI
ncbi:hypothetical protein TNCT_446981 [Trichonephila clavata]|uniref:Uncharacterized protein n=1 Tax=Trichonephila clavata TaxID=2740835 RepID=A0A8X6HV82_TRICU|nr:hypothetical protein TNCT_446981 [Trichonephila clavata]